MKKEEVLKEKEEFEKEFHFCPITAGPCKKSCMCWESSQILETPDSTHPDRFVFVKGYCTNYSLTGKRKQ